MSLRKETQQSLAKHNISPNKILGQNFLIDQGVVNLLLDSAEISDKDMILEVGSGTGTITKQLARRAKGVIAVEKDPALIPLLRKELETFNNITIINKDILEFSISDFQLLINSKIKQPLNYKLVGAPPYYLTARLFRHFLQELKLAPSLIAVIIPEDIAKRIVAKPPRSSLLSTAVQLYGDAFIIKNVSRNVFWPRPGVDSAILVIKNIQKPQINELKVFEVLKAGFSSPRKKLGTNISKKLNLSKENVAKILTKLDIDTAVRPQALSIEKWKELVLNIEHLTPDI